MSVATLTPARARVLTAFRELSAERPYPPSLREVAARAGLRSPETVHRHMRWLVGGGYLTYTPRSRTGGVYTLAQPS